MYSVKCRRTGKRLSVKKIDLDKCKNIKQLRMVRIFMFFGFDFLKTFTTMYEQEDRVSHVCRSPYIMRRLSSFVIGTELW